MIACRVEWKCLVACLLLEESQQPTCPQDRQSRRWTQESPIFKHSSQPLDLGRTGLISLRCEQFATDHSSFVTSGNVDIGQSVSRTWDWWL
jgi:hypothetical protein